MRLPSGCTISLVEDEIHSCQNYQSATIREYVLIPWDEADRTRVSDAPFDSPYPTSTPQMRRPPEELLYVFVRLRDRAPMSCLLRFNGPALGWEVRFLVRGWFFVRRGAFGTRALAVQWAEAQRKAMENGAG